MSLRCVRVGGGDVRLFAGGTLGSRHAGLPNAGTNIGSPAQTALDVWSAQNSPEYVADLGPR
eukprot:5997403-Alexandrium_andersonii.AAC.1